MFYNLNGSNCENNNFTTEIDISLQKLLKTSNRQIVVNVCVQSKCVYLKCINIKSKKKKLNINIKLLYDYKMKQVSENILT